MRAGSNSWKTETPFGTNVLSVQLSLGALEFGYLLQAAYISAVPSGHWQAHGTKTPRLDCSTVQAEQSKGQKRCLK